MAHGLLGGHGLARRRHGRLCLLMASWSGMRRGLLLLPISMSWVTTLLAKVAKVCLYKEIGI